MAHQLTYIKGGKNFVTKALSRIDISDNQEILNMSELCGYNDNDLPDSAYPILYENISKAHKTDAKLQQKSVSHKDYTLDTVYGYNQNHRLIFRNIKISLPMAVQKKNVYWYHNMIFPHGDTHT